MKILVLVGPPASGKSTFAKNFLKSNQEWLRVNRDDLRFMANPNMGFDKNFEKAIIRMQKQIIDTAVDFGFNVLVDNTHCKMKYINFFLDNFKEHEIYFKTFTQESETLLIRNLARGEKDARTFVPPDAIMQLQANYLDLVKKFNFVDYALPPNGMF